MLLVGVVRVSDSKHSGSVKLPADGAMRRRGGLSGSFPIVSQQLRFLCYPIRSLVLSDQVSDSV